VVTAGSVVSGLERMFMAYPPVEFWLLIPSFRGDAKHRTAMCNRTSENLEIPGLVLRTIPE
jgi:hypothetical protein